MPELLVVGVEAPSTLRAVARTLVEEYAALPHTAGRWPTMVADIAALPHPFVEPSGVLLVAMDADDALGCGALAALEPPHVAEIKRVYVRPTARGRGVGEALTVALLSHAARLGYRTVRLDTAPELRAAQALYRRLGFRPIAQYREGLLSDALCFERAVTALATQGKQEGHGGADD